MSSKIRLYCKAKNKRKGRQSDKYNFAFKIWKVQKYFNNHMNFDQKNYLLVSVAT